MNTEKEKVLKELLKKLKCCVEHSTYFKQLSKEKDKTELLKELYKIFDLENITDKEFELLIKGEFKLDSKELICSKCKTNYYLVFNGKSLTERKVVKINDNFKPVKFPCCHSELFKETEYEKKFIYGLCVGNKYKKRRYGEYDITKGSFYWGYFNEHNLFVTINRMGKEKHYNKKLFEFNN